MAQANERLYSIITPAVEALGVELLGIEYLSQGQHSVLRIYIDSEAGITVDNCADVSHQVSAVLDVEDPIRGEYTLEVSSPGADRPLFTAEHYRQVVGEQISVRLHAPQDGRRKFKGELISIDEDGRITIEVDGIDYTLPLADVDKANLVPQW